MVGRKRTLFKNLYACYCPATGEHRGKYRGMSPGGAGRKCANILFREINKISQWFDKKSDTVIEFYLCQLVTDENMKKSFDKVAKIYHYRATLVHYDDEIGIHVGDGYHVYYRKCVVLKKIGYDGNKSKNENIVMTVDPMGKNQLDIEV